jgi:hypothetical protein
MKTTMISLIFAVLISLTLAKSTALVDSTVTTVQTPAKGDTFTYKCADDSNGKSVLVFASADPPTTGFTVVNTDTPPANAPIDGDKTGTNNIYWQGKCNKDMTYTVTLNDDNVKSASLMIALEGPTLDAGKPFGPGMAPPNTGIFFHIDITDGNKLGTFMYTFPDGAPDNKDIVANVMNPDGATWAPYAADNKVGITTCPAAAANKRYGYAVSFAAKEFKFGYQYNLLTVLTLAATKSLDMTVGQLVSIGADVTVFTATDSFTGYATCADYLEGKPASFAPPTLWDVKYSVTSDKAQYAILPQGWTSAYGGKNTLTGYATVTPPAQPCVNKQVALPDGTCQCAAIYKAPDCNDFDDTLFKVVTAADPAPAASTITYTADMITKRQFPGWQITLPADNKSHLQIAVSVTDSNDKATVYVDNSIVIPAIGNNYDVVTTADYTFAYCNTVNSKFSIAATGVAGSKVVITFTYVQPTGGKTTTIGDAPQKLTLPVATQWICYAAAEPAGKTSAVAVNHCSLPDNGDDSADVAIQYQTKDSIYSQNGWWTTFSKTNDNIFKVGRLIPVQITGPKGAVVEYTTASVDDNAWPIATGLKGDLSEGTIDVTEPSGDVTDYTFKPKVVRKVDPPTNVKDFVMFENPSWNAKLGKSPCFVMSMLSDKEAKKVTPEKALEITIPKEGEADVKYIIIGADHPNPIVEGQTTIFTPAEISLEAPKKKDDDDKKKDHKGLIIGLVIGGSILLVIAVVGGYYFWQRSKRAGYTDVR